MKFSDIEQFPYCGYRINVSFDFLEETLDRYKEHYNLDMNPDFQRTHVWNNAKRSAYIEHVLKGGKSGLDVYFNCPGWNGYTTKDMVLVDGLQRITAVLKFMDGYIPAFGYYHHQFEGRINSMISLMFNIAALETRKEVLQWYLTINSGGVVHTKKELDRVRKLLESEQ